MHTSLKLHTVRIVFHSWWRSGNLFEAEAAVLRQSGLTLFELLAVMALAAVLAALDLGSFQSLLRTNRHAAEVNALVDNLVNDLAFSRSEAIKRRGKVTLCPALRITQNRHRCASADSAWQGGWAVLPGGPVMAVSQPQGLALRIQGSLGAPPDLPRSRQAPRGG